MRLGQMARKLAVSQAEIVRYLLSQNLEIEEGSNVKLGEAHIRALYGHYAPPEKFETVKHEEQRPVAMRDDVLSEQSTPVPVFEPQQPESQEADAALHRSSHASANPPDIESVPAASGAENNPVAPLPTVALTADQSDTIRAPKIELAGLKVIGKINLPEPKRKESAPADETAQVTNIEGEAVEGHKESADVTKPRSGRRDDGRSRERSEGRGQDDRRRTRNNPSREQRPYKNPIAAQREREIEDELERKKQKAAQDKERRTQNYQKRVKHSPPTKAARLVEEQVEELSAEELKDKPTTWFAKFMKWLRS